eukprot:5473515-Prymnesium_polylepis.1
MVGDVVCERVPFSAGRITRNERCPMRLPELKPPTIVPAITGADRVRAARLDASPNRIRWHAGKGQRGGAEAAQRERCGQRQGAVPAVRRRPARRRHGASGATAAGRTSVKRLEEALIARIGERVEQLLVARVEADVAVELR